MKRLAKKYHSLKQDLQRLQDELVANPDTGADLGSGIRKVRMAINSKNKGKSHGARIITFMYILNEEEGVINLIFIYDKEERDSISTAEIESMLREIE